MADISFKKFVEFVDLEGDVSDEQLDEIFGIFRNNAKLDAVKKRQADLHAKRKALRDKEGKVQDKRDSAWSGSLGAPKGGVQNADWDDALDSRDRKFLAKRDRLVPEGKNEDAEEWQAGHEFALAMRKKNKEPSQDDMASWSKPFAQGFKKGWGVR